MTTQEVGISSPILNIRKLRTKGIRLFSIPLVHKNSNRSGTKYREDVLDFHQTTGFKLDLWLY